MLISILKFVPLVGTAGSGDYFFGLSGVVFGTLTASAISDASQRLAKLRAIAVDEATVLLSLTTKLGAIFRDENENTEVLHGLYQRLWDHTCILVSESRRNELKRIALGCEQDPLMELVEIAQTYELQFPGKLKQVDRLVETRSMRLSLENAGLPGVQLGAIQVIGVTMILAFAFLTQDFSGASGVVPAVDEGPRFFADFERFISQPRILFAYLCSVVTLLYNLCNGKSERQPCTPLLPTHLPLGAGWTRQT